MKILVAGASGQLALSLAAAAVGDKDIELTIVGRPTLDVRDMDLLARVVDEAAPDIVVNAAACTAMDRAESERDVADAIDATGAGALSEVTAKRGVPVIHLSTDYDFDGRKLSPYDERDAPNPETAYGRSKLAGEERVAAANPRHLILRTSWLYSRYGHNFVKTILRLARERPELAVVADQHGNPTCAADLASAILAIARRLRATDGNASGWGAYHIAGTGSTTWHGFAQFVVAAAARYGFRPTTVRAITTAEFPTAARRPANSQLDCSKLAGAFGLQLAPWTQAVERCVAQLCAEPGTTA